MKIMECVPNFSEGRDKEKVHRIVEAVSRIEGIRVLDVNMDGDHNRSVVTFMGTTETIQEGARAACNTAVQLIDMTQQQGVHPRIGAVDVVPFVPLEGATMEDAVTIAHRFGRAFAEENGVPVYFYGKAALHGERTKLAAVRRGCYENLCEKVCDPEWCPDAGPAEFNAKSGATCVGARNPLIAFNVNLDTDDIGIAQSIARSIRESSGGLPCVQAIGVTLESRGIVQVSMNLVDYDVTPPRMIFDIIREKASAQGVDILESELIGLIPRNALKGTSADDLMLPDFGPERIIENHL